MPGTTCHSSGVGYNCFLFRYNIYANGLSQHDHHLKREYYYGILGATPQCSPFADSRHHPCHNTKTKLKSRGSGGRRHSPSDHDPFAKWKTLRAWEGREGRWTESTDDGPASEKYGTCVIMGDRRLSPLGPGSTIPSR